jgi:hypothetical protein
MPRVSRGFVCAIFGLAMTLLAWFGPWAWPAWPAFAMIRAVFGSQSSLADLSRATRALAVIALIALNSGAWACVLYGTVSILKWRPR